MGMSTNRYSEKAPQEEEAFEILFHLLHEKRHEKDYEKDRKQHDAVNQYQALPRKVTRTCL